MMQNPQRTLTAPRAQQGRQLQIYRTSHEVHCARIWVRSCLSAWGVPGPASEAAESVAAEIVNNAVQYGRGRRVRITMWLRAGELLCEVRDGSRQLPVCLAREPLEEGGRGMVITRVLADDWGVRRHLNGKTVWFRITT